MRKMTRRNTRRSRRRKRDNDVKEDEYIKTWNRTRKMSRRRDLNFSKFPK